MTREALTLAEARLEIAQLYGRLSALAGACGIATPADQLLANVDAYCAAHRRSNLETQHVEQVNP